MEWVAAYGWEGLYEITREGLVRNTKTGHVLSPSMGTEYPAFNLWRAGQGRTVRVHSLLLCTFVRPSVPGECCNHINGNKQDNRLENLEWVTYSENNKHAYRTGLKVATWTLHRPPSKTHCKRGHPFDGSNLHIAPNGDRVCKKCRSLRGSAYQRRKKLARLTESGEPCSCRGRGYVEGKGIYSTAHVETVLSRWSRDGVPSL